MDAHTGRYDGSNFLPNLHISRSISMKSEQFKLYDKGNAFELRVPFLLGSIARFSSDSALCSFCVHSCSIQFIHELSCFSNFWFEMFRELVICSVNKISLMNGLTSALEAAVGVVAGASAPMVR